ncbi:hypothetical protein LOD99_6846 [Oopsacas minuta]|uniref:Uncharacterized protein n=1 Tax=Oopsacas minuta TaxID=111878 RepID=A0AAV7JJJ1_9METZ|nr:hypothetical protein LOD99_6846 [Oopsacas minuta]
MEVPTSPKYDLMKPVVTVRGFFNPWGVAVDDDIGFIYVTDWSIPIISIFSETGEFLNTFTNLIMREAWGIAIRRDKLYVTDTSVDALFYFQFDAGLHLVGTFGNGRGSADNQFDYPNGITVNIRP